MKYIVKCTYDVMQTKSKNTHTYYKFFNCINHAELHLKVACKTFQLSVLGHHF